MKTSPEQNRYATMGVAALLPGMQYMCEIMQAKLDEMRAMLAHAQGNGAAPKRGRPPKSESPRGGASWGGLTPEERSTEMKRRQRVGAQKRAEAEAEAARASKKAMLSAARKRQWDSLSKAQQKARTAKMTAGRLAKQQQERSAVA